MSPLLTGLVIIVIGLPVVAVLVYALAQIATLAYFHSLKDYHNIIRIRKRRPPMQVKG